MGKSANHRGWTAVRPTGPGRRILPLLALAWAAAGCGEKAASNLLLVTVDTLRADRVGSYGHEGGLTPHLDRLAQEGILFENVITPSGTTFPAHASLFTGLYPHRHGVRWNGHTLEDSHHTLAEILAAAGWDTAAFVAFGMMLGDGGLRQGFETASDGRWSRPGPIRPGREVNRQAVRWLELPREKPFFLWLHYYEPHSPYPITPHARDRLGGYSGPLAKGASVELFFQYGGEALPANDENRRALSTLYEAQVLRADRHIGEIVDLLRRRSELERTVIVVTADHGQMLGERGVVGHSLRFFEPVQRVPLLLRLPKAEARRVEQGVALVDVMPTLLDLLALPVPEGLEGRSLAPALRGEELSEVVRFAELPAPFRASGTKEERRTVAAFSNRYKLLLSGQDVRIFDVQADPLEEHSLEPGQTGPVFERLRALADSYRTLDTAPEPAPRLSPETAERLRSLGYLEELPGPDATSPR